VGKEALQLIGAKSFLEQRKTQSKVEPEHLLRHLLPSLSTQRFYRSKNSFKVVIKKMKIKGKIFYGRTGTRGEQEEILEMDIRPGLKKGSKIKFKSVGDEEESGLQDVYFVVEEICLNPMADLTR
jgi:hypothetical protein